MQVEVATEKLREAPWAFDAIYGARDIPNLDGAASAATNIRAVGFIAKPDKANDLTICMKGPLMKLLRQAPGFGGAMILRSHQECRSVMILTFWETERQATHTCWEEFLSVRRLISPLVDLCSRVQTFQGIFPEANDRSANRVAVEAGTSSS